MMDPGEQEEQRYQEAEERVAELIDATWPECEVVGVIFPASRILKQLDPSTFRQQVLNYMDAWMNEEDE